MRFYYDIVFMNSTKLGGHNCTKFETKGDFLFVEGFDDIAYVAKRWQQYNPDYYNLPEYFNI